MANNGQRLRIVCRDGLPSSTTVYVVQPDGTEIPVTDIVREVRFTVRSNELATACVEFEMVEADVIGEDITV